MKFIKYDGTGEVLPEMCSHVVGIIGDEYNITNRLIVGEVLVSADGDLICYPQNGGEPEKIIYWCELEKHPEGQEYYSVIPEDFKKSLGL